MIIFCFNPKHNRETLQEFNDRVQEYCLDEGAVALEASCSGGYLLLKVVTVNSAPIEVPDGTPMIIPAVRKLNSDDKDWEEQLESFCQQEEGKATDEDPVRDVSDVKVVMNDRDPTKGWAVMTVIIGEVDMSPEGQQGEEQQVEVLPPSEVPPSDTAVTPGFQG